MQFTAKNFFRKNKIVKFLKKTKFFIQVCHFETIVSEYIKFSS